MTVDELIAALEDPDENVRLDAASRLAEMRPPPLEALPALVAHLDDKGSVYEEWNDWNGAVVGGASHHVADRALGALMRLGAPGFSAVVAAVEAGTSATMLRRLVALVPMDTLCGAGPDVIARARQFTLANVAAPPRYDEWIVPATDALTWAHDELSRSDDRIDVLRRRLDVTVGPTAQLAAEELGTVAAADARRAATILAERLLREAPPGTFAQTAAAASLDKLGPVLDAPLASRLVEVAPTKAMFHCWPELLPAVARYPDAAALGPWLLAWVRDERAPMSIGTEHHAKVRNAAATAIGRLGDGARPLHDELAEIYAAGPEARRQLVLGALPDRSVLASRLGERWRSVLAGDDRKAIEDVLNAIHGLRGAAAPLLDAILPFVEGPRAYYVATLILGDLGEAARPAVPALIRALKDPSLRKWACFSLRDLGPDIAASAIAPLEDLAAEERAAGVKYPESVNALKRLRGE